MNEPVESDAAARLPPPPPDRSSSSGSSSGSDTIDSSSHGSSNGSAFVEQGEHQPQQPLAKKARLKTTNNEDDDTKEYSVEFRRLEMAMAAVKEEQRATEKVGRAAGRAMDRLRNSDSYDDDELLQQQRVQYERDRHFQEMEARHVKAHLLARQRSELVYDMICCKLRHNPPVPGNGTILTEFDREVLPQGYANRLGQALTGNTVVSAITLFVQQMLPAYCEWDGRQALVHIDPLLRFVQSSQNLRHVQIHRAYALDSDKHSFGATPTANFHAMLEAVFSAIAANPSIEDVCYKCFDPTSLFDFISKAKSIKSLDISFRRHDIDAFMLPALQIADESSRVEVAIGSTLERLTLENIKVCPNMAATILENLQSWAPVLKDLTLSACPRIYTPNVVRPLHFWQGLATFLSSNGTTSAPMLRSLQLTSLKFDLERMMLLLNGLRKTDSSGCSAVTLVKLSMSNCIMDDAATSALVDWMRTPIRRKDGRGGCRSSLCELQFDCVNHLTFGNSNAAARTIASMLLMQEEPVNNAVSESNGDAGEELVPTIGSQIRTLSLPCFSMSPTRFDDVLSHLSHSHKRVQLEVVRLGEAWVRDCRRLRLILPKLPSIRELHIGRLDGPVDCSPIVLAMMWENIRLGTLSCDDEATVFTARELRRAKAFQGRNQFLCRHFTTEPSQSNVPFGGKVDETARTTDMGDSITTTTETGMDDGIATTSRNHQRLDSSLYPPLFQVADPVLACQQWHIPFRGLSMLGESIGTAILDE